MDLNLLLQWVVIGNSVMTIALSLESRRDRLPRITVALLVAAIWAALHWTFPNWAGVTALTVWVLLELLPEIGQRQVEMLVGQLKLRRARRIAEIIRWLRPVGECRAWPALIDALRALEQHDSARALPLLQQAACNNSTVAGMARVRLAQQTGDWQPLGEWVLKGKAGAGRENPEVFFGCLRALGEGGHRAAMLAWLNPARRRTRRGSVRNESFELLIAAAFVGDVPFTLQISNSRLVSLPPEHRRLWVATALQASGQSDQAAAEFRALTQSADPAVVRAATRRLIQPVVSIVEQPLTETEARIVLALKTPPPPLALPLWPGLAQSSTLVTRGLVVLLFCAFLIELPVWIPDGMLGPMEIPGWKLFEYHLPGRGTWNVSFPGGSELDINLVQLGARLIPTFLEQGQWWRIFTSAFLHMGPVHLGMNVLSLWVIGRWVERGWGSVAFAGLYLTSAWGSMAIAPWLMRSTTAFEPAILMGASGGVMGLIGGMLAQTAWWWRVRKNAELGASFRAIALVAAMQIFFDAYTPGVSREGHLSGMVIGFVYGVLFCVWEHLRLPQSSLQQPITARPNGR